MLQQGDLADRGVEPVNVPVVTRTDYVFDAAAPGGSLGSAEQARLDAWFRGLGLGYGDSISSMRLMRTRRASKSHRSQANTACAGAWRPGNGGAGRTGHGPGDCQPVACRGSGCPNWSRQAQPNYNNRTMSNFGCGVNSNLAAMVANPEDLIHGREGNDRWQYRCPEPRPLSLSLSYADRQEWSAIGQPEGG